MFDFLKKKQKNNISSVCSMNDDPINYSPIEIDDSDMCTDYTNRCGNCHKILNDNDKYCPYCGTKRGEGKFEPYENVMTCIYGPPPEERVHQCKKCGYEWSVISMIDSQKYCPQCGGNSEIVTNTYEATNDIETVLLSTDAKDWN